jgi:hypothetical protein
MAAAIVTLSLQLATVLAPEVVALYKAIAALRSKGVSAADAAALVQSLEQNVQALDADTLATLALIK